MEHLKVRQKKFIYTLLNILEKRKIKIKKKKKKKKKRKDWLKERKKESWTIYEVKYTILIILYGGQILGTMLAPNSMDGWTNCSINCWLGFSGVSNLIVSGSGTIDGRGSTWWNQVYNDQVWDF